MRLVPLVLIAALLTSCATPERMELPIKLLVDVPHATVKAHWHDDRPAADRTMSEVPTAAGSFVTLGDDISSPSVYEYLRNRVEAEGASQIAGKTVRVVRLRVTAEGRNPWIFTGTRPPIVALAQAELKAMPTEFRSRVEAHVLLEVDGRSIEGKSLIPFERQPSSSDISYAIRSAVDGVTRQLSR